MPAGKVETGCAFGSLDYAADRTKKRKLKMEMELVNTMRQGRAIM
jgi:hypothetical protein